ncbi:MAG: hypothetical protein FJ304_09810 [Planctomycetes bacterium]|nr:hypothetical protein [Planctomycetota bacterium]
MSTSQPTNAPSLPSTADAVPYVPVSWAAAAAAAVAFVFVLALLAFGYFAFVNKKPLLMEELLVLPAVAVVLSFAARRMIRNSEGTRTGLLYGVDLVNAAWWTAVVVGLCYVAYLFAIDFAIRRDARAEVDRWVAQIKTGTDEDVGKSFHRTLHPGERQSVAANDLDGLRAAKRDELLAFANSDLVRLARRNPDTFRFESTGVTWEYKPGVIECLVTGTATCAEGTFPLSLRLRGFEGVTKGDGSAGAPTGGASAGRQWMITRPPQGGFLDQSRSARTTYGWLVAFLEGDGALAGKAFLDYQGAGPVGREYAHRAFVTPGGDRAGPGEAAVHGVLRSISGPWSAAAARVALGLGDADYAAFVDTRFFTGPGDKARFLTSWNGPGLRAGGDRLRDQAGNAPDKEPNLVVTEAAVELHLPIEVPLLPQRAEAGKDVKPEDMKPGTARGRLVLVCTDPSLIELVKKYRVEANPANGSLDIPADLRSQIEAKYRDPKNPNRLSIPWRVVRAESDLKPVVIEQKRDGPPGGPGGPGGGR